MPQVTGATLGKERKEKIWYLDQTFLFSGGKKEVLKNHLHNQIPALSYSLTNQM